MYVLDFGLALTLVSRYYVLRCKEYKYNVILLLQYHHDNVNSKMAAKMAAVGHENQNFDHKFCNKGARELLLVSK